MAVVTTVYVAYDPRTGQFTFTGGNTAANDGTVDLAKGYGNRVTYSPTGSRNDWVLTDWNCAPDDGVLTWAWVGAQGGDILVTDQDVGVTQAVEYEVTLDGQEVTTRNFVTSGPVIINKPTDGLKSMGSSGGSGSSSAE